VGVRGRGFLCLTVLQITPDAWSGRLAQITQTASRYHKPMFERIWAVVSILCVQARKIIQHVHDKFQGYYNRSRGVVPRYSQGHAF
jgi:hypothetical protein